MWIPHLLVDAVTDEGDHYRYCTVCDVIVIPNDQDGRLLHIGPKGALLPRSGKDYCPKGGKQKKRIPRAACA